MVGIIKDFLLGLSVAFRIIVIAIFLVTPVIMLGIGIMTAVWSMFPNAQVDQVMAIGSVFLVIYLLGVLVRGDREYEEMERQQTREVHKILDQSEMKMIGARVCSVAYEGCMAHVRDVKSERWGTIKDVDPTKSIPVATILWDDGKQDEWGVHNFYRVGDHWERRF